MKLCTLHTTDKFMEMMSDPFTKPFLKDNPDIEKSIFNSIHSVCLDTMPGWKTKGEEHSFLENYDKK